MDPFFSRWFSALDESLRNMSEEECGRLFAGCAADCAKDALKDLYADLFRECGGDPDIFFSRLHELDDVDGRVVESGKAFELIFTKCGCPLHTEAHLTSPGLCECSRQSILCELKELMPDRQFEVVRMESILAFGQRCRFRITEKRGGSQTKRMNGEEKDEYI